MKSSKLKATLAAVSAIAVMASASTSFAAVNTTATYNTTTDKVDVVATVTELTPNKEVTYLVKSGETIVYIDQATLSTTGTATFNYKIAKNKIADLQTAVTYGTDGTDPAPAADNLGLGNVTGSATNATIEYYTDKACTDDKKIDGASVVAGKGETIYAKITPDTGYEIETVTIGGTPQEIKTIYDLTAGQTITVTTKETVVTPVVTPSAPVVDSDLVGTEITVGENKETVKASVTTVLKVTKAEAFDEYGVIFDGVAYPAINADGNSNVAVRILTTKEGATIDSGAVRPYYKKSGVYYYADDNTEIK